MANDELARTVLALFRDQIAPLVANVGGESEHAEARRVAHTVVGAALGIGAFALADRARAVEAGGGASALAALRESLEATLAEIERIIAGG